MNSKDKPVPKSIDGVAVVHPRGAAGFDPVTVKGERWVTLIPAADTNLSCWEFSLDSGRVIRTADERGEPV